jgi:hypothetical protein
MNRRWPVGREVTVKRVWRFRVVQGSKERGNSHLYGDHVLQMWLQGEWWNVPDAVAFVIADFKYENEEVLYPREHGKNGGDKHLSECKRAARHGWERAQEWLEHEQGNLL